MRRKRLHDEEKQAQYAGGLSALVSAGVPFLVGGGWALYSYLGRWRATKDIDIFLSIDALEDSLLVLARAGFRVEVTDAAWLAKARRGGAVIDIIFCYKELFPVDDTWYENGRDAEVLGVPVKVVGPEEMIVSKCFVAARDRFDGGDVSWLLRALGAQLDWSRIELLMRDHWQVLLWQLIHFLYVYPSERHILPYALMRRLLAGVADELQGAHELTDAPRCRGPMLDPKFYKRDLTYHGAADPRPRRALAARLRVLSSGTTEPA